MKPSVIAISRQFGSGGREIGAELAKRLEIPFYDKALFDEAAKHSGIHPDFFEKAELKNDRLFAYLFHGGAAAFDLSLDDRGIFGTGENDS